MRKATATSRRVIRTVAYRNVDWESPIYKDPEVLPKANQFRAWVASASALKEKYAAPPTAIDFGGFKETARDKSLIESIEKLYSTASPPPEVYAWDPEDKAQKEAVITTAEEQQDLLGELIDDAEKEMALLKDNRLSWDTTVEDIYALYPDIEEEVEDELENREWFKDTVKA
mmetsp:Transcript_22320/g.34101  ORF Transcript_22320/g.34101 Transcript_22320/m.34101 type:complete len:172 (-) Transcript_22320:68-583(-)